MDKVYIITGTLSANTKVTLPGVVYSDYEHAESIVKSANKNRGWFDRMFGAFWEVRTLHVIN